MTGIVNSDPNVVEQIDKDVVSNGMFIPKATSDVIKLSVATKGDLRKGTSALSDEGFDKLISKTKEVISEKVSDMKAGKIEKNPYKFGDKTPCEYCDFKGICNFDINLIDNNYKRISKKTMEDILDTNDIEETDNED
jgi:ATP-dependent helicase/nuclease subunit B